MIIGLTSGYVGGWLDTILMRCTDAVMALPGLMMAMAVVGILGYGVFNAMIGLSIAFMPAFARLIRGQVLAVREESFVEAARVIGARPPRIILRHVLPNIASPLVVQALMSMGFALLAEGAIAYIGLSVQPPDASLGSMLQQGFSFINATPRLILVPGAVIVILSASFNAVADGIRDALAKQGRRHRSEHEVNARHRQPGAVDPLLQVRDLAIDLQRPDGDVRLVEDVSFTLDRGKTLGIVGETGSGKSLTAASLIRPAAAAPAHRHGSRARSRAATSPRSANRSCATSAATTSAWCSRTPHSSLDPAYTIGNQMVETDPRATRACRRRPR